MLCTACGTDTPAPFDRCRQCSTPFPVSLPSPAPASFAADQPTSFFVPAAEPFTIGEMFGRYRILKLLGAGGMGQVYHAWDEELNEAVALKVIRQEFAGQSDADARFKRELSVARHVTHTNVVRIHDLGTVNGVRYISMPFIEGLDLSAMLAAGRLPTDIALSIARQLAAGLSAAHAAGVIHRDLKPANVMVDRSGHVFLMDFGLARSVEVTQLTTAGMVVGTVEYMSPEQARGEPADHRSDIYTLGLIFYEMFTGSRPFKGETPMSRLTARLHTRPIDPRIAAADVPPYLAQIILTCLEPAPADRYQSVDGIVADLDAHQASGTHRFSWRSVRSRRTAAAGAGVALAVGVAAAGLMLVPGRYAARKPSPAVVRPVAQSLAILPFQNASGDASLDWLATSLGEMLGSGVGQGSVFQPISLARVQQILNDLHLDPSAAIDPSTVQRIADFTNADTVVFGRYARVGDQVRIEATLQDLKHSRTVALPPVVTSERQFVAAAGSLIAAIERGVGSPQTAATVVATSGTRLAISSTSVEALRNYGEGVRLVREGDYQGAEQRFQAATRADGRFAMAYSQLGLALAGLGRDEDAERASRRAVALSDSVNDQERYRIEANHARVLHDNAKAITAYEKLGRVSPQDDDVLYTLAGLYESAGLLDKAREGYARVLAREPKHVDALLSAGRVEIKQGRPQDGIDYLNRGLSLAIALNNDEEKGRILHAIGIAYRRLNKPEDALRYYQEALVIRRKVGQKGGIAATVSEIAEVQRLLGRTDAAQASYADALQLQREIGDRRGSATTLLNFASFQADRGRNDEALKMFKESLSVQRDIGDTSGEGLSLNNIGTVYFSQGRYDDALIYFQQALQIRDKLGVPGDVAETLHNLGESSWRLGAYDQALSQFLRALNLYRSAGNAQGAAIESYATAKVFELQGRYGAAAAARESAVKAFRASGERSFWAATVVGAYGRSQALIGRTAAATSTLDDALARARALGNPGLVAQMLAYQGDALFYDGQVRKARALYEQAAREAAKANDREQTLLAKIGLARLAVAEGGGDPAALTSLGAQASNAGMKDSDLQCQLLAGDALLRRRDYARARETAERVLDESERLGVRANVAAAHYLLARAFEGSGQRADSERELAQARQAVESMRKEAGTDDILNRADVAAIVHQTATFARR